MLKPTFYLHTPAIRANAKRAIDQAADGDVVTIKPAGRTDDQNAKFHAICSDISKSGFKWAGKERSAAEWKVLLVSGHTVATAGSVEIVPGLENEFVNIRESTALMGKKRGASLIEYSIAWAAGNDIKLGDMNDDET